MKQISTCLLMFMLTMIEPGYAITPITAFSQNSYLGQGNTLANNGQVGAFSSFVAFFNDGWESIYYFNEDLRLYETILDINSNGFFSAEIIDASNPFCPKVYNGSGYCGSAHCQLSIDLAVGTMQKTVFFNEGAHAVKTIGAIHFKNGSKVQWEEYRSPIPQRNTADQTQQNLISKI
jgi:hypothetical protein